jgi:hypothetical protein
MYPQHNNNIIKNVKTKKEKQEIIKKRSLVVIYIYICTHICIYTRVICVFIYTHGHIYCMCVCIVWNQIQGLAHARQAFYHPTLLKIIEVHQIVCRKGFQHDISIHAYHVLGFLRQGGSSGLQICYIVQAGLELRSSCLHFLSAEITGLCNHAWL